MENQQLTVAELIVALQMMPQDAKVWVDGDYGMHHCEGVRQLGDDWVYVEIG